MTQDKEYPDATELFRLRAARRRESARAPVPQKMEIAAKLRDASEALAAARAVNKARLASRRAAKS